MNRTELNVLVSITNDAVTLARRIQALTWELDRTLAEDPSGRTPVQTSDLGLMRDAMRRSGEEMVAAVEMSDHVTSAARRALTEGKEGS